MSDVKDVNQFLVQSVWLPDEKEYLATCGDFHNLEARADSSDGAEEGLRMLIEQELREAEAKAKLNNVDGQSVVVYLDKYGESRSVCKHTDLPQFFDSLTNYEVWLLNASHVAPHLLKNIPERFITRSPPEPEPAPEPPPRIGVEVVEGVMFGEPVFIGTGTPLMSVVSRVVEGMLDKDIIEDFPQVTSGHIRFARRLVTAFAFSRYRSK